MSKTPLLRGKKSPDLSDGGKDHKWSQGKNTSGHAVNSEENPIQRGREVAAAGTQALGHVSAVGTSLSGGKNQKGAAKSTGGPTLNSEANNSHGGREAAAADGIQPHGHVSDAGTSLSDGKNPKGAAKSTGGPTLNSEANTSHGGHEAAADGIQPHGHVSDAGTSLSDGKNPKGPASSPDKNTGGLALNSEANPTQGRGETRAGLTIPQGQQLTSDGLEDLAMRLGGVELAEVFARSLPKKKPVNHGKKRQSEAPAELDLDVFRYQSGVFAMFCRHTTMAAAANAFSLAVERFASGKDNKKRVADTELSKAGMSLSEAAQQAPPSEAIFANLASRLTGDAQLLLLSDAKPMPLRNRWKWWRAASDGTGRISRLERLLAAPTSSRDLMLPVHTAKGGEKGLIDKRQILYAVAVTLPVSLLASAAGIHVFSDQGAWVAGAGVCVWIAATAGMVLNQYGKFKWELWAARHLNRLCLLGGAILLSFYAFRAYFPSKTWALWFLIGMAVVFLGVPWGMSMFRADDVISARDADTVERPGRATGNSGKMT